MKPATTRQVIRPRAKAMPVRQVLKTRQMNGHPSELGNSCWEKGDFGAVPRYESQNMGGLFDDIGSWATTTLNKTLASATTSLQKSATQSVQSFVLKLTGADGSTKNVSLTPEQAATYNQTGVIPPSVLPAGFVVQQSFFEQYKTPIMIAGGVTIAALLGLIIYKAVKK